MLTRKFVRTPNIPLIPNVTIASRNALAYKEKHA